MPELSRRSFLFLAGGTGASAVFEPGRQMVNKLIPYITPPERIEPGQWVFYATTCRECPAGCGLHVWHRDGRITKIEGNPDHPINQGGVCPRGQAAVQGQYDPDRLKKVTSRDDATVRKEATWEKALDMVATRLRTSGGRAVVLSDLQTGTLDRVMRDFTDAFGAVSPLYFETYNYEPLRAAHLAVFGREIIPYYHLDKCDFILSFGADFLETWVSPVGLARKFSRMRSLGKEKKIGRFAYVGPRLSMTAANADDFLHVRVGSERWIALAILQLMKEKGWGAATGDVAGIVEALGGRQVLQDIEELTGASRKDVEKVAREFATSGSAVALASPMGAKGTAARDAAVAAALLNQATGAIGKTIDISRPHALGRTLTDAEIEEALGKLDENDTLIIHNCNPVFTRPGLREKLRKAGMIVYLGHMPDETAEIADIVLPLDYPLETWGDYEPYEGIHGLLQPTMQRLYDTRSAGEILLKLARRAQRPIGEDFEEILRQRWETLAEKAAGGEEQQVASRWDQIRRSGGLMQELPAGAAGAQPGGSARVSSFSAPVAPPNKPEEADLWAWPSIMLFDGRLANRAWLQESPEPVSFLAWEAWVDLHPEKAHLLNLKEGDVVEMTSSSGKINLPVRVTEDVQKDCAAVMLGQGHTAEELSVARGIGDNAFAILGGNAREPFGRVTLKKTGQKQHLVHTAPTRDQHKRDILRWIKLSQLKHPSDHRPEDVIMPLPEGYKQERDLYRGHEHKDHRWAMVVDLHKCIGCGACGVACYAENNVPIVGKRRVREGREMAWLRVVPYRHPEKKSGLGWLPMLCQHCDAAPCEPVCPVFAAVHNEEGLNAQIYNRCIGTRYCSNNCPYKVRRFNWTNIRWVPPLDLQLNPEVTVRSRGVMEKCTFCVQRIRQAQYAARLEGRELRDQEVKPACLQTCPTGVYTFGDLLDPESEVHCIFKEDPRRYQVLKELNTKTAVVYLQKIEVDS